MLYILTCQFHKIPLCVAEATLCQGCTKEVIKHFKTQTELYILTLLISIMKNNIHKVYFITPKSREKASFHV